MDGEERTPIGERLTRRLLERTRRRPSLGFAPSFYARLGLDDPWAPPAELAPVEEGEEGFVYLSAAPYYAMLRRLALARKRRERRTARFLERRAGTAIRAVRSRFPGETASPRWVRPLLADLVLPAPPAAAPPESAAGAAPGGEVRPREAWQGTRVVRGAEAFFSGSAPRTTIPRSPPARAAGERIARAAAASTPLVRELEAALPVARRRQAPRLAAEVLALPEVERPAAIRRVLRAPPPPEAPETTELAPAPARPRPGPRRRPARPALAVATSGGAADHAAAHALAGTSTDQRRPTAAVRARPAERAGARAASPRAPTSLVPRPAPTTRRAEPAPAPEAGLVELIREVRTSGRRDVVRRILVEREPDLVPSFDAAPLPLAGPSSAAPGPAPARAPGLVPAGASVRAPASAAAPGLVPASASVRAPASAAAPGLVRAAAPGVDAHPAPAEAPAEPNRRRPPALLRAVARAEADEGPGLVPRPARAARLPVAGTMVPVAFAPAHETSAVVPEAAPGAAWVSTRRVTGADAWTGARRESAVPSPSRAGERPATPASPGAAPPRPSAASPGAAPPRPSAASPGAAPPRPSAASPGAAPPRPSAASPGAAPPRSEPAIPRPPSVPPEGRPGRAPPSPEVHGAPVASGESGELAFSAPPPRRRPSPVRRAAARLAAVEAPQAAVQAYARPGRQRFLAEPPSGYPGSASVADAPARPRVFARPEPLEGAPEGGLLAAAPPTPGARRRPARLGPTQVLPIPLGAEPRPEPDAFASRPSPQAWAQARAEVARAVTRAAPTALAPVAAALARLAPAFEPPAPTSAPRRGGPVDVARALRDLAAATAALAPAVQPARGAAPASDASDPSRPSPTRRPAPRRAAAAPRPFTVATVRTPDAPPPTVWAVGRATAASPPRATAIPPAVAWLEADGRRVALPGALLRVARGETPDTGDTYQAEPGRTRAPRSGPPDRVVPRAPLIDRLADVEAAKPAADAGWARRASGDPAVRSAGGLFEELARATTAEQVVRTLFNRADGLRDMPERVQAPVRQVVQQIREEVRQAQAPAAEAAPASLASSRASHLPAPVAEPSRRGAPSRPPSEVRVTHLHRTVSSTAPVRTPAARGSGGGADRVMKLVRKLESLIHLAEVERRLAEARRQVRMAEDTAQARAEGGHGQRPDAAPGQGEGAEIDIEQLGREVLEVVARELEFRRERRMEDHDESHWW